MENNDEEEIEDYSQESNENASIKKRKIKKTNHIASEQKRRQTLRERFKQLSSMVPALQENQSLRSEAVILQKTVEFMNQMIEQREQLRHAILQMNQELGKPNDIVDSDEEELRIEPYPAEQLSE